MKNNVTKKIVVIVMICGILSPFLPFVSGKDGEDENVIKLSSDLENSYSNSKRKSEGFYMNLDSSNDFSLNIETWGRTELDIPSREQESFTTINYLTAELKIDQTQKNVLFFQLIMEDKTIETQLSVRKGIHEYDAKNKLILKEFDCTGKSDEYPSIDVLIFIYKTRTYVEIGFQKNGELGFFQSVTNKGFNHFESDLIDRYEILSSNRTIKNSMLKYNDYKKRVKTRALEKSHRGSVRYIKDVLKREKKNYQNELKNGAQRNTQREKQIQKIEKYARHQEAELEAELDRITEDTFSTRGMIGDPIGGGGGDDGGDYPIYVDHYWGLAFWDSSNELGYSEVFEVALKTDWQNLGNCQETPMKADPLKSEVIGYIKSATRHTLNMEYEIDNILKYLHIDCHSNEETASWVFTGGVYEMYIEAADIRNIWMDTSTYDQRYYPHESETKVMAEGCFTADPNPSMRNIWINAIDHGGTQNAKYFGGFRNEFLAGYKSSSFTFNPDAVPSWLADQEFYYVTKLSELFTGVLWFFHYTHDWNEVGDNILERVTSPTSAFTMITITFLENTIFSFPSSFFIACAAYDAALAYMIVYHQWTASFDEYSIFVRGHHAGLYGSGDILPMTNAYSY